MAGVQVSHVEQALQRAIEARAQEMILEHQAEMSRAFDELIAQVRNGQELVRAYHQGRQEERQANLRILRAAARNCTHGSRAWKQLQTTIRQIDPTQP